MRRTLLCYNCAMADLTNHDEVRPQRARGAEAAWTPVSRSSTHQLVIDAIEERIMTGTLTVGDLLPPERELASRLQVSRAAVREAIRVLEAHGVLRSEVGSGRGAGTFVASLPSAALAQFLRLHVALSNFRIAEVLETRTLLEHASAALAAERADAQDRAELERLLAVMDDPAVSREAFNDADTAFHVAIARAGGNALFSDLTEAIRASLRAPILEALTEVADWEDVVAALRTQHHEIHRAITEGRAEDAAALSSEHIRTAMALLPDLSTD